MPSRADDERVSSIRRCVCTRTDLRVRRHGRVVRKWVYGPGMFMAFWIGRLCRDAYTGTILDGRIVLLPSSGGVRRL